MLSSGFIKKVLEKLGSNKVNSQNMKKILFDVQKDRELFEAVFESMVEGVIVFDKNHKVQYINKNALDMFSLELKSVTDKDISVVFSNKDIINLFNRLQETNKEIYNKEIDVYRSGEVITLRVNVFPLLKNLESAGTILMFLDITEQKREQAKLRRSESLASLTTLAAGVAHEIKNPLSSIDIHIQLMERLLEDLPESEESQFRSMLGIISEEITRLNKIISDFLFSVRPTILNKKSVNLEKILNDIILLISNQINDMKVKVTFKVERNFPHVVCDPNYIKNAFLNIIKNAMEACKKGGSLIISLQRSENTAVIIFEDTGKGIDKKDTSKIFDPYYTTKDFGTGLGLTIVYKIIKEHKGDISVSSRVNKGTTFTIKLPIYEENRRLIEDKDNHS